MYEMEGWGGDAVRGTVVFSLSAVCPAPAPSSLVRSSLDSHGFKGRPSHLTPCVLWPSYSTLMTERSDKDGHV